MTRFKYFITGTAVVGFIFFSSGESFPSDVFEEGGIDEIIVLGNSSALSDEFSPAAEMLEASIHERSLGAVVNLFCHTQGTQYITATGVIIDPRGYILSNAHAAGESLCTVRRGSPAKDFAEAVRVFVPRAYDEAGSDRDRARFDISIWKIQNTNGPLPFFNIALPEKTPRGSTFIAISYPAEFLSNSSIVKNLELISSNTTVEDADLLFIRARSTTNAQHGSSGGILADPSTEEVRGLIFGVNEPERDLFALSPYAINKAVLQETGKTLHEWLDSQ